MHVELADDLLESQDTRLGVLALIAFGQSERHQVVAEDFQAWRAWAEAQIQDRLVQDELLEALSDGESRAAIGPRRQSIRVSANGQGLTLSDAVTLLGYPLRVFLENGRNDRDFLLAFADVQQRPLLDTAAERGWLVFETAGGVNEIVARLIELKEEPFGRFRFYTVFDSDSRQPNALSHDAQRIKEALAEHHTLTPPAPAPLGDCLKRRAIENYLDLDAFIDWLESAIPNKQQAIHAAWKNKTPDAAWRRGQKTHALYAALALREVTDVEVWSCLDFSKGRG
ncbi:hypothetical protein KKF91_16380, partial [Myxococcota bacterium]|nr:hypothetical protein [Myxococcota bacterium]